MDRKICQQMSTHDKKMAHKLRGVFTCSCRKSLRFLPQEILSVLDNSLVGWCKAFLKKWPFNLNGDENVHKSFSKWKDRILLMLLVCKSKIWRKMNCFKLSTYKLISDTACQCTCVIKLLYKQPGKLVRMEMKAGVKKDLAKRFKSDSAALLYRKQKSTQVNLKDPASFLSKYIQ